MAESERSGSVDSNSGKLWAFGDNSEAALGDGTQTQASENDLSRAFVVLGPTLTPIVRFASVSAGLYHTLALADDGTVWSWGRGENGRLGHGSSELVNRPKRIEAFDNNRALVIAAGYHHSMAINHKNQIYCWGSGWSGQLGTGDTRDEHKPVRLTKLDPPEDNVAFTALAGGYRHSVAISDAGRVYTWGSGDAAQLGHGPTIKKQPFPKPIESVKGLVFHSASASEFHTVALTEEGVLYAWGTNRQQQLGYGDANLKESWKPQPVEAGGIRFVCAAAGSTHTLAAGRDGLIWRWGRVPLSKSIIDRPQVHAGTPQGLGPVIEVSTRTTHCLAMTAKGDILAWGYNEFGQVKPGSSDNVESPVVVQIPGPKPVAMSQIAAGGNHSVAVSFFGKITIPAMRPTGISLHSNLSSLSATPLSSAKSSPRSVPSPRTDRSGSLQQQQLPPIAAESLPDAVRQILSREEEIAMLEQELQEQKESLLRKERKLLKDKEELLQKEKTLAKEREMLRKQLGSLV